ncbi:MAG: PD-(D/E)XK motif protein [Thermoplasmataceae archaeon]
MMNSPEHIGWEELEADPPRRESFTARYAFPSVTYSLLAAIDSDRVRHLLIPLSKDESDLTDNRSRGLSVRTELLHVRRSEENLSDARYIDITCFDNAAREMFDLLGRQIAVEIAKGGLPRNKCVANTLERWRYFWSRPLGEQLTRNEVIGLFAELWFQRFWLFPFYSSIEAIAGWRGPFGSRHDYEWHRVSVEIKGTTSINGIRHWINGVDQLAPPENGRLFLFSLQIREESGGQYTLPGIIKLCRDKIGTDYAALESFDSALALTGYSPAHDEDYDRIRFRVVTEALYEVKEPFPRITTGTLKNGVPSGVIDINYEIALEGLDSLVVATAPSQQVVNIFKLSGIST